MKNRIIASIITLVLIFANFHVFTFAEELNQQDKELVDVLQGYGILKGDDTGNFNLDKPITRAEMVVFIARILAMPSSIVEGYKDDVQEFSDVPSSHWAYGYIKFVSGSKAVNGYEDGTFRPEKNVLYEEATKMIVSALGYDYKAKITGTYPDSYMAVALNLGILKYVGAAEGKAISRRDISRIIYNSLEVPQMEKVYSATEEKYVINDKKTIKTTLENVVDLSQFSGIVTGNENTDLLYDTLLPKGQVRIDNSIFLLTPSIDSNEFLGSCVDFYVVNDDTKAYPTITRMNKKVNKNSEIFLNDISKLSTPTNASYVEYYNSNDKLTKIDLDSAYIFILNGRKVSGNQLLNTSAIYQNIRNLGATLRFIDNNADDRYDVVFALGSEDSVVDSIYESTEQIILKSDLKISNKASISLDTSNVNNQDKDYVIVNAKGDKIPFSEIKKDDSVSVFLSQDGKNVRIVLTSDNISGTVDEINSSTGEITVSGKKCQVAYKGSDYVNLNVTVGKKYKFYKNSNGHIFYADETKYVNSEGVSEPATYGYVMKKSQDSGLAKTVSVKILTAKKEIVTLNFADKVTVDDVKISDSTIAFNAISEASLISYELDAKGNIKKIKTPVAASENNTQETTLTKTFTPRIFYNEFDSDGNKVRYDGTNILAPTVDADPFAIADSTALFVIPVDSAGSSTKYDDEAYTQDFSFKRATTYDKTSGFDVDEETNIAKAMIVKIQPDTDESTMLYYKSPIGIINKVTEYIDSKGDSALSLEIYQNDKTGKEQVIKATIPSSGNLYEIAKMGNSDYKKLYFGDVIRYRIDKNNIIRDYAVLFSKNNPVSNDYYFSDGTPKIYNYTSETTNSRRSYIARIYKVAFNKLYSSYDSYVNYIWLEDQNAQVVGNVNNSNDPDAIKFKTNIYNVFKLTSDKAKTASFYDAYTGENETNPSKVFLYFDNIRGESSLMVILE